MMDWKLLPSCAINLARLARGRTISEAQSKQAINAPKNSLLLSGANL